VGHSGAVQGFTTNITMIPKLKIGVAIFTNTNTEPSEFAREALAILIPAIQHAQERQRPEPLPAPAGWQRYVGVYRDPFGRSQVRIWHNQLQLISADEVDAKPIELTPEGENKFRMKNGPSSGELLVFELDSTGTNKNSAIAWRQLGYYDLLARNYTEAIRKLNRAIAISPQDIQTWVWLGQAYQNSGDKAKACEAYRKTLEIDPNQPDASRGRKTLGC